MPDPVPTSPLKDSRGSEGLFFMRGGGNDSVRLGMTCKSSGNSKAVRIKEEPPHCS